MNKQNIEDNKSKKAVVCHKCEHYYVTWDKNSPHGCRRIGFKSRQIPNIVVRNNPPGMECLLFKEK